MPGAPFFLRALEGFSTHLVTLDEYLGSFSDKEKWISFIRLPTVAPMFWVFCGSAAGLLDDLTRFKMPRFVAFYEETLDSATFGIGVLSIMLLQIPFFAPGDYTAVEESIAHTCAFLPSIVSLTCRLTGSGIHHLLMLLNLPSAAIALSLVYPGQYLFVLILAALTVVEFATYARPVVVLACVWIKIYGQLLKAFCPNFELRWLRKTSSSLEEVCRAVSSLDVQYRDLHAELDVALARPELPAHLGLSSFALFQQRWYFARLASDKARTRTLVGVQRSLLVPALRAIVPLLENELSRRGPSPDIEPRTFDHAIHELTGIFIKHLIPLPQIKHLGRPFRLRAFLPFVLPYPLLRLIPTRAITFDLQTTTEALFDGPAAEFTYATIASLRYFDEARLSLEESVNVFELLLRTFEAQEEAVKAEDKAHEAVLEAVLLWKERKDELERKRFKQE